MAVHDDGSPASAEVAATASAAKAEHRRGSERSAAKDNGVGYMSVVRTSASMLEHAMLAQSPHLVDDRDDFA